jgi:hypothetical protein
LTIRSGSALCEPDFNIAKSTFTKFYQQLQILKSVKGKFESTLYNIKQLLRADIFDSDIEASRELLKNGFLSAAGALVGVVLEKHLAQVCENHKLTTVKKDPTIRDYNDLLKTNVYDVVNWRFIQRLGDIRNYCDHKKEREPTDDEVHELIDGVDKVSKTIY